MAKNLKEYGEELKKMTQDTSSPKAKGKVEFPSRPTSVSVEDHIKDISKGRDGVADNAKKRIK